VPTTLVNNFTFKVFDEPIPVYRIEQRHRTRVIADTILMYSDVVNFRRILDSDPASGAVERVLDALDTVSQMTAREYGGKIDFSQGEVRRISKDTLEFGLDAAGIDVASSKARLSHPRWQPDDASSETRKID
jgi:hypothetical protein